MSLRRCLVPPCARSRSSGVPWASGLAIATLAFVLGQQVFVACGRRRSDPPGLARSEPVSSVDTALPVEFTVENGDARPRALALVQGGFAFASGAVRDAGALRISGSADGAVASQARPLAYWPDGSIKWAELSFYLSNLGAHEKRVLQVDRAPRAGGEQGARVSAPDRSRFAADLRDGEGSSRFEGSAWSPVTTGAVYGESSCEGPFSKRAGSTNGRLSVASFPALRAVRYRFAIKQLADGASWHGLQVAVPHAFVEVRRGSELGARPRSAESGSVVVDLIGATEPVDTGTGRQWEVWGYDDPASVGGSPLVPLPSPAYLRATVALGRFVVDAPQAWRENFRRNYESVFAKLAADPRSSGWKNYGSLPTRRESGEYLGYYNQEYDPATALFLAYASTGRREYLDTATDLAGFYRDMLVSPDGGCYQHRAPVHALQAHVYRVVADGMATQIRARAGSAQNDEAILDFAREAFREKGEQGARQILGTLKGKPFEARVREVCALATARLMEPKVLAVKSEALGLRGALDQLARDPDLVRFGFDDVDRVFRPFFERYGGSWDDLPAFHVDILPVSARRHLGSHSLVEMLVLAYFLGGDESFRETALRVARHHVEDVDPRSLEMFEGALRSKKPMVQREVAWPLINLLALDDLTLRREVELNRKIRSDAMRLARALAGVPPERTEGSIHSGICTEALARFHERTLDEAVGEYLVRFTRYWAKTQWNAKKAEFHYLHGDPKTLGPWTNGLNLYGMAYSADLSPDRALRDCVRAAWGPLTTTGSSDGKDFAQKYRSTWRALDYIAAWSD